MKENQKFNKKALIGVAALIAVIAVLAVVYSVFRPKPVEGSKKITIEVINKEEESAVYHVKTDAEYLRQAMEETEGLTFEGEESPYGLMVTTVNGEEADAVKDGAYWSFYVDGAYCDYGIDGQPVKDGNEFVIKYEVFAAE